MCNSGRASAARARALRSGWSPWTSGATSSARPRGRGPTTTASCPWPVMSRSAPRPRRPAPAPTPPSVAMASSRHATASRPAMRRIRFDHGQTGPCQGQGAVCEWLREWLRWPLLKTTGDGGCEGSSQSRTRARPSGVIHAAPSSARLTASSSSSSMRPSAQPRRERAGRRGRWVRGRGWGWVWGTFGDRAPGGRGGSFTHW